MRRKSIAASIVLAGLTAAGLAGWSAQARAAAEVHKFSLVLSAVPTSVSAGEFNDQIEEINTTQLEPVGRNGIDTINNAWLYQAEFRYFVRPNVAVSAGVGQLRSQTKREFLPALQQDIQLRVEMLSVPIHVGGAYYFTPYNQGDFQARAYVGGGVMGLVHNRIRFQVYEVADETTSIFGRSFLVEGHGDSPGFYGEFGVHMFFAARYSVLIGALYRSAEIRDMRAKLIPANGEPEDLGVLSDLDTSGLGARMAIAIGF